MTTARPDSTIPAKLRPRQRQTIRTGQRSVSLSSVATTSTLVRGWARRLRKLGRRCGCRRRPAPPRPQAPARRTATAHGSDEPLCPPRCRATPKNGSVPLATKAAVKKKTLHRDLRAEVASRSLRWTLRRSVPWANSRNYLLTYTTVEGTYVARYGAKIPVPLVLQTPVGVQTNIRSTYSATLCVAAQRGHVSRGGGLGECE